MKKIELLAPAGNMDALRSAVQAGADAIYLGLKNFSARAFAGNFSHEEFLEAIAYCHTRNVKIYVTINTMLFEPEIENVKKEIAFLYENDCDALLIQDLGLFHYVRTCYPDFEIHCSTQMHIHNVAGVKWMKEQGAQRVVLARETPIEIIREACATGTDIEVFSYGAICISYSGQCLMSQSTKNRSANRGMCAQCCRLKYYPNEEKTFDEGDYILSPKDLNTIHQIPDLIEAGVSSLKIEGRMKRPEYVWLVTNTFRQAIDAYYLHEEFHVDEQRLKDLAVMFNRGFSQGHIFHDDVTARMSQYRPNHQGVTIGKVLQYSKGRVQVKLTDNLHQHDGLRIINEPTDTGLTAVKIYKNDKLVNMAQAGDVVWLECHSKPFPKKGQNLQKTSDTYLMNQVQQFMEDNPRTVPVKISYQAHVNQPFSLTVEDEDGNIVTCHSSQNVELAKNAPMTEEKIARALRKTSDYPFAITDIHADMDDIFIPVSILNQVRRDVFESLYEKRKILHVRKGKQPYQFSISHMKADLPRLLIHSENENDYMTGYGNHRQFPVVNENAKSFDTYDDVIYSSIADLSSGSTNAIAGMNMNIANSYAIAYVLSLGVKGVIFSSEVSNEWIHTTLSEFENRYGFTPYTYRLVYGKRDVMYIKDHFVKNHSLQNLSDKHGNIYQIRYNNGVTFVKEPDVYRSDNPYCYGSYIIFGSNEQHREDIELEANEELFERI